MDKRKRENTPVLRFLRAFFLSRQSFWSLARAWETRFAKRERRESISFFAHIFSTNIFLDRNERWCVHLASISSARDVNDEWTTHSIWPPNLTPFRFAHKKTRKEKNQHFPRERQREEHTLVLRDFAGVPTKFATCAVLRDVDAENIFYSRVACARFLPNFGHDDTNLKREE